MKGFIDALLLKGLWKFKPIHVVMLWLLLAYQGWMASPYFMYYVVGAPEPGAAQRYVGMLRVEGEGSRGNAGYIPPRYFLDTAEGELEFHCGYRPRKFTCISRLGGHKKFLGQQLEIGYDPYWGIERVVFLGQPPLLEKFSRQDQAFWLETQLKYHTNSLAFFIGLVLLYLYFIWQAIEARRTGSPTKQSLK